MNCHRISSVLSFVVAFAVVATFTLRAQAQMFGMPAPSDAAVWNEVTGLVAEEEPIAFWMWNEAGGLNPDGNDSEKWFADEGLQNSLGKLKKAIVTVAAQQGDPLLTRFAEDVGWKLLSKAGYVELEHIDPVSQTGIGTAIIRLGEDAELIEEFFVDLMEMFELEAQQVGKDKVYQLPEVPIPFVMGVHADHIVVAVGEGQWKRVTDRIDDNPGTPEWLQKRLKAVPISRRGQFAFGSAIAIMELLPAEAVEDPIFQKVREALALDGIKSVSIATGTDSISNISMIHAECEKENGLASVIDVDAIANVKLKELPGDSISSVALRFSPATILNLLEEAVEPEQYEEAMIEFADMAGLDLKTDIVDHLEGTVRYYATGSIINPKQVGIIRIKDELKFQESFAKINDALSLIAERRNLEFVEQEKKGIKLFGIKNFGISGYWAVHQGELYVSTNSRAINSHIRKAAKVGETSIIDTEFAKQIVKDSASMGLEGPIMVQHYDFDQITEVVLPLLQGAFNFIPPEVQASFDFGPGDFPPIESMLGLRNTSSMLFKASGGYTGISRYDTPVALELSSIAASGVAVGMVLPALQATREAARRTQSMNNQRQLVLALLNYEAANGHFPPAYTVDEGGNPLLSWRVQILPFMEQQDLYDQFHHDEPWDSDHNIELLEKMPMLFVNPSSPYRPGWSDFVAPISEDSILAPGATTKMSTVADGTSNTVMLIEVGMNQQVPWSAPQDIEVDSIEGLNLISGHPGIVLCAMCDGSVRTISTNVAVEKFIAACKKSDGAGLE